VSAFRAPRAPGERQTAAAGLYSGAMTVALADCPVRCPTLAEFLIMGRITPILVFPSETFLKPSRYGLVLSSFAPVLSGPVVPAGKLNTTQTVLSSGDTPEKTEFCIGFVKFCAEHAEDAEVYYFLFFYPVNPVILSDSSFFTFQYSIFNCQSTMPKPPCLTPRRRTQ